MSLVSILKKGLNRQPTVATVATVAVANCPKGGVKPSFLAIRKRVSNIYGYTPLTSATVATVATVAPFETVLQSLVGFATATVATVATVGESGTRRPPDLSPKLLAASNALDRQLLEAGISLELPP